ncbi:hypothetical protein [Streptomyces sirii]|uniref:hypothetical protein n=1 Tax=Streptomyces sirii TaxID=3127701 RepID=UPI003D3671F2
MQRHRPASGGLLDKGVEPGQIGVREAGVGQVHRTVQYGDAHSGVTEQLVLAYR